MVTCPKRDTHILCVSWEPTLARTRELLFTASGYKVTSAMGYQEAIERCSTNADLLVLGHSVPRDQKRLVIDCFRKSNCAPVLSLLRFGQSKLPEADYGVEYMNPERLLDTIRSIVAGNC